MKQLGLMTLIIIGAGIAQAEITPQNESKPEGKYVPSQFDAKTVEEAYTTKKIPKNAFDFPIRKGGEDMRPNGVK